MISINGPKPGSDAAEKFLMRALAKYEEQLHYKVPSKTQFINHKSTEAAVQTDSGFDLNLLNRLEEESSKEYFDMICTKYNNTSSDDSEGDSEEDCYDSDWGTSANYIS